MILIWFLPRTYGFSRKKREERAKTIVYYSRTKKMLILKAIVSFLYFAYQSMFFFIVSLELINSPMVQVPNNTFLEITVINSRITNCSLDKQIN